MRLRFLQAALLGFLVITNVAVPQTMWAGDEPRGLFVNLATDDTWAAAKAISFAHQESLKNGHDTAIWLNVRAVYLADRKRASHVHGLIADRGYRFRKC